MIDELDKGKEGDRAAGGSYKRCMITGGSRATDYWGKQGYSGECKDFQQLP